MSQATDIAQTISRPIFFITPDITWAVGLETLLPNFHIVCLQNHPLLVSIQQHCNVFCLQLEHPKLQIPKNTGAMLATPEVQEYIQQHAAGETPAVMFFKPQPQIDKICQDKGYLPIGNTAQLNQTFEDKLWLARLAELDPTIPLISAHYFAADQIDEPSEMIFDYPLVLQTSKGWAGKSSYLIKDQTELLETTRELKKQPLKLASFIKGKTYTINACITGTKVLKSLPAIQVTAPHPEFTNLPLATCGRVWDEKHRLSWEHAKEIGRIADSVGNIFSQAGYKGFFGLDFLISESGYLYLLEVNPRMTASTSFYTQLEIQAGVTPLMLWHLLGFLHPQHPLLADPHYAFSEAQGSQILLRNTGKDGLTPKHHLIPGRYNHRDSHRYLETYQVADLDDPQDFLLYSPHKGNSVSEEAELVRYESLHSVLDQQSQLMSEISEFLITKKKLLSE